MRKFHFSGIYVQEYNCLGAVQLLDSYVFSLVLVFFLYLVL